MNGIHKTVSIYPETAEKIHNYYVENGVKKVILVQKAIDFYLKYRHLEDKLKDFVK